ncbi:sulfurtransferase complex subunit TusD [Shewanella sp. NIFS-20-20]|uniref:sulfurtransferase complex subunit TusD n=1 Tax=Shewanella sp. NIFS-20-20 TaxID=2853806 RepID=UPI001C45500C|nr:sulfurtransferase complex subunit TusD [Shewanella sp. NIFS-20-20]MBV7315676.1 sulfurtransferase complex subunit TusD [Shewanella sp. NIFS-20-20]
MSKLIIQVNGKVYGNVAGYHAYRFTEAAIEQGHEIVCVFFYQDGVSHSNNLLAPATDEFNLHQAWIGLADKHQIALINCVSAGLRRGVLSQTEANELGYQHFNCADPFVMGGLGELVTGIERADRWVNF